MLRSNVIKSIALTLLLSGIATADDDLFNYRDFEGAYGSVEAFACVDERLTMNVEVWNDRVRIEAVTTDGDSQSERFTFSRDLEDSDGVQYLDVFIGGTKHNDTINIEFHEVIDEGRTAITVFADDGADVITVFNTDDRFEQVRGGGAGIIGCFQLTQRPVEMTLEGGRGDDIIINQTGATSSQVGGLGLDILQGGSGDDYFHAEDPSGAYGNGAGQDPVKIDRQIDMITDLGDLAVVYQYAISVVDQVTGLHRPKVAVGSLSLSLIQERLTSDQVKTKNDVGTPGKLSLPLQRTLAKKSKADVLERYAVKTTYKWELVDDQSVQIDPIQSGLIYRTVFCVPIGEDVLEPILETDDQNWTDDAPPLEATIEEL